LRSPSSVVSWVMIITDEQRDRFFSYLRESPEGCLEWQGGKNHKGHGRYRIGPPGSSTVAIASRVAFFLHHGWVPLVVRHTCDNPPCCRPEHLLAGDYADNSRDMVERGRGKPGKKLGSSNHNAVLDEGVVRDIKELLPTMRNKEIAAKFGISPQNVSLIRHGKAWCHVK
jgi:hypothetical protein